MDEQTWLAERFGSHREHLRAVAYRMLGSTTEAEDAVQEAWLRLSRADTHDVENLGGWLTTVVARVCLDMLRARKARAEVASDGDAPDEVASDERGIDPEREVLLADAIGPALLVVLDTLAPGERVALVLHDMFGVAFEEIATILGRSPDAARQLASRARRRVQGAGAEPSVDRLREREIVGAFLAAARQGNFEALLAVLDPDVVVRADATARRMGAVADVRGSSAVANGIKGKAVGARLALIDGRPGAAWILRDRLRAVFDFRIARGRIVSVDVVADPEKLAQLEVVVVENDASAG